MLTPWLGLIVYIPSPGIYTIPWDVYEMLSDIVGSRDKLKYFVSDMTVVGLSNQSHSDREQKISSVANPRANHCSWSGMYLKTPCRTSFSNPFRFWVRDNRQRTSFLKVKLFHSKGTIKRQQYIFELYWTIMLYCEVLSDNVLQLFNSLAIMNIATDWSNERKPWVCGQHFKVGVNFSRCRHSHQEYKMF